MRQQRISSTDKNFKLHALSVDFDKVDSVNPVFSYKLVKRFHGEIKNHVAGNETAVPGMLRVLRPSKSAGLIRETNLMHAYPPRQIRIDFKVSP